MKVRGRMISNMVKALRNGKMDHPILDHTSMERNKALVYTNGMMAHNTQENGMKTRSMEW